MTGAPFVRRLTAGHAAVDLDAAGHAYRHVIRDRKMPIAVVLHRRQSGAGHVAFQLDAIGPVPQPVAPRGDREFVCGKIPGREIAFGEHPGFLGGKTRFGEGDPFDPATMR